MKEEKKMAGTADALTIEDIFERLGQVITELEQGERSLEDSFSLYAEGMELVEACSKKIDLVEKKVKMINERGEESEF